jgi:hypothetical protein
MFSVLSLFVVPKNCEQTSKPVDHRVGFAGAGGTDVCMVASVHAFPSCFNPNVCTLARQVCGL